MEYISCKQAATNWNISERRVRELCANKKVSGAFQQGKVWNIPKNAPKPIDERFTGNNNRKTILITGASRGIGRATAEKFLQNGYKVYGTYNASLQPMKELEKKYGKENFVICGPFDFTKTDQIIKCCDSLVGIKFDSMFLNAGIFSENDDFLMFNLEDFTSVFNCNFYSPLIIACSLSKFMNIGGSIVLMGSNDAYSGAYGSMSYSISKNAVISLAKCLSVNFGRQRVRVNSISPGAINTDMNTPEQEFEAPLYTPIERIAQPYEVANVVYFLCSDDASFINGENITIDGGYSNVSVLLKKEISRNRKFVGYDYLINSMLGLKKGESALCLDTTTGYGWMNNPEEENYLNSCYEANKNGAIVERIIIFKDEYKQKVFNNPLIKEYLKNIPTTYLVLESEVKSKCASAFSRLGQGYIIYNTEQGETCYIDTFANEKDVGYITTNPQLSSSIKETYTQIKNAILTKKVKNYRNEAIKEK